jgi:FKBP-type peptidyl-prolyl cis-trans isomerase
MHKILISLAAASLAFAASCSGGSPATPAEAVPSVAWPDPILETLDRGGVQVDIFEQGTGTEAKQYDQVSLHYSGWIKNSENVFDSSSWSGAPISFRLGKGEMIAGWDKAVLGMRVGTRARLHIPWKLAYGKRGRPPVIPGQANLVFDVELVEVR